MYLCVVHQILVLYVVSSSHYKHNGLKHNRSTQEVSHFQHHKSSCMGREKKNQSMLVSIAVSIPLGHIGKQPRALVSFCRS